MQRYFFTFSFRILIRHLLFCKPCPKCLPLAEIGVVHLCPCSTPCLLSFAIASTILYYNFLHIDNFSESIGTFLRVKTVYLSVSLAAINVWATELNWGECQYLDLTLHLHWSLNSMLSLLLLFVHVLLFAIPWTAGIQDPLSSAVSWSLLIFLFIELMMPSNYPFSSCPLSFLASGSFPVSWLFTSSGQNIGISALATILPMNIQNWFPLGLTDLISL